MAEDPDLLLSQIGLRIQERRRDLGLTQKELAEKVEMQQSNVARIERGEQNLTVRTLCKLAEALETTATELFVGSSQRPSG
ncbi:MAG: helix-turn-helix transcriptional regulator [Minicystis sp.]